MAYICVFRDPGMMCFVCAVWDEWRDAQKDMSRAAPGS
jgi:hypothetical protein